MERIHVYPIFEDEPTHEVEGDPCWCEPEEWDEENGTVVVHRRTQ